MDSVDARSRILPAVVSLLVGTGIFAAKLWAWRLTGSVAVLSDALESIVNVVAAAFALFSVRFAAAPADREHPYGHGKIEFVSAAFEGGLVAFAAVAILVGAIDALVRGPALQQLDWGLALTAAAGAVNLALGAWLVRRGRALRSKALEADGLHVLSDVWTTVGVLAGLSLVRLTGIAWLDPLAAIMVGLWVAHTGVGLVREAAAALLDAEDPALTRVLLDAFEAASVPGVIKLHQLRVMRVGAAVHIDAHAIVPGHWPVSLAHDAGEQVELRMLRAAGLEGELALHLDPCRVHYCAACDLDDCPARVAAFDERRPLGLAEAVDPRGLR